MASPIAARRQDRHWRRCRCPTLQRRPLGHIFHLRCVLDGATRDVDAVIPARARYVDIALSWAGARGMRWDHRLLRFFDAVVSVKAPCLEFALSYGWDPEACGEIINFRRC